MKKYADEFNGAKYVVDKLCGMRSRNEEIPGLTFIENLINRAREAETELRHLANVFQHIHSDEWFSFVDGEAASRIIETRQPLGLFLRRDGETYVGIDNSNGDAWTEEFKSEADCLLWLAGVLEVTS